MIDRTAHSAHQRPARAHPVQHETDYEPAWPPQSHRFSTKLPRKRTCECSTSTAQPDRQEHTSKKSERPRRPITSNARPRLASNAHDTAAASIAGKARLAVQAKLHRARTCRAKAHGIACDCVRKDNRAHRSLACRRLAHQQHLQHRAHDERKARARAKKARARSASASQREPGSASQRLGQVAKGSQQKKSSRKPKRDRVYL